MNATSQAASAPRVWPPVQARDAVRLIRSLVGAFGSTATGVYRDGETVAPAELAWPPAEA